jgi:hypothetical protein
MRQVRSQAALLRRNPVVDSRCVGEATVRDLNPSQHEQNDEYDNNCAYQTTTDVHFISLLVVIS